MKRIVLLILLSAFATTGASALNSGKIRLHNLSVVQSDETASVSFQAAIDRKAVSKGVTVAYAPVITDGEHMVSLPPIVIQSKRAAKVWQRHEWANNTSARYEDGIYVRNGETVNYQAEVPFQHWMYGSRIEIEVVTAGCCSTGIELFAMAEHILPAPAPQPEEPSQEAEPDPTTAELLASAFPFVLPASEFNPNEPIRFYDDERDNSLTIYYKINSYIIDPDYAGNRQTLNNLLAAIDIIEKSEEAKVGRVVVAGFASPEGSFEVNDRLAWERAVSIKEFILNKTNMRDRDIALFNGSADWRGLRLMVERDRFIPAKQEVLDIIDFQPIWDSRTQTGRTTQLRNLNGGESYRYMKENIFPKLRNGAFIRVYYEDNEQ